jgi:hypothetical protein
MATTRTKARWTPKPPPPRRHGRSGSTDEIVQAADVVITMGCGDACPILPGKQRGRRSERRAVEGQQGGLDRDESFVAFAVADPDRAGAVVGAPPVAMFRAHSPVISVCGVFVAGRQAPTAAGRRR